jgi:hypothetical protein
MVIISVDPDVTDQLLIRYIFKGSEDGVQHSALLGFWTWSGIVKNTKEHNIHPVNEVISF